MEKSMRCYKIKFKENSFIKEECSDKLRKELKGLYY